MTGYVRKDTTNNIADGNVINAADLDSEFDGVQDAFNASTGHKHDGTAGEGATINALGPTQDVTVSSTLVAPKTTNTVDIGSSALKFKDLFLAGNGSVGGTLAVTGVATLGAGAILNTPASVTLTNATGLPIATGVSGLGTGIATFLATPSSANLIAAVTNETGTGSLVFATSPTLVTPVLGAATGTSFQGIIGNVTPAAGSFTTVDASGAVTLSGGTANGVTYLNGSKVLTSGSALVFTGTNLGIGQSSPSYKLVVNGTGTDERAIFNTANSSGAQYLTVSADTGRSIMTFVPGSSTAFGGQYANPVVESATVLGLSGATDIRFYQNSSEGMRLTSTGLGIGTSSPTTAGGKLTVQASGTYTVSAWNATAVAANVGATYFMHGGVDANNLGFIGAYFTGSTTTGGGYLTLGTRDVGGSTSEKARIDASGNLGLGVTPSAWFSSYKALQLGSGAAIQGSNNVSRMGLGANWLSDSAGNDKYIGTGFASVYTQLSGAHAWYTAPSGTAGDAISFTQAMTLDASGNLALGKTSASYRADVQGNFRFENTVSGSLNGYFGASDTGSITLNFGGTTTPAKGRIFYTDNSDFFAFYTNSTERARIDSSGNLLVGTTTTSPGSGNTTTGNYLGAIGVASFSRASDASLTINTNTDSKVCRIYRSGSEVGDITVTTTTTSFNSTSDYRLKTVVGAVTGHGARIDALEPIEYTWNSTGLRTRGFLAHKFQEVYANSVTGTKDAMNADGKPEYQSMQAATSEVIADLVAEIQSLRQRLSAANL